jgi:hypothetical protein
MTILRSVIPSKRLALTAVLVLVVSNRAAAQICLDVNVRFTGREPSRDLVQSMKSETSAIWNVYGVLIRWSDGATVAECATVQGSADVTVDYQPRRATMPLDGMLGKTLAPLPVIEHAPIYLDHGLVDHMLASLSEEEVAQLVARHRAGPEDMGRALGRVLAHEIGHLILGERDHQPRGLMRPQFRSRDLIEHPRTLYTLSAPEVSRLRQREVDLKASSAMPATSQGCRP